MLSASLSHIILPFFIAIIQSYKRVSCFQLAPTKYFIPFGPKLLPPL
jgi:hypothetical protein